MPCTVGLRKWLHQNEDKRKLNCHKLRSSYVTLIFITSSNHRLESAGLNALEQLLFLKYWIGNREDGNTYLVLKA